MKVDNIKKLPKKFSFKSTINKFGILYHAEETKHGYKVTCDCNPRGWEFSKDEFRRKLFNNEYVVCN